VATLGISAADSASLARFKSHQDAPATYIEAFTRLLSFNLGHTTDGVPTWDALVSSTGNSLGIIATSFGIVGIAILTSLFLPGRFLPDGLRKTMEFVIFLPSYVFGFILLVVVVLLNSDILYDEGISRVLLLGTCVGIAPSVLAISIISNAFSIELKLPYVDFLRAYGYGEVDIYRCTRKSVLLRSMPGWDKLLTMQLSTLIFTEAIVSFPGLGSFILISIQRSDLNALLATVICTATAIGGLRLIIGLAMMLLDPRPPKAA